jgi:geranylgeranyl pyrophosphate synthase
MALAVCADLGGEPKRLAPAAAALELVHCASLIHDDLPALDNDDFRRGRPSCHRAFTEASAILAGDMLIALAHECVARGELSSETRCLLTGVVSRAFIDLCAGQELDLIPSERRNDLLSIHQLKTGALFSACTQFGAIGAGCSNEKIEIAARLGQAIGLIFQIADDFLDVHGADSTRGRPGSSDIRNGKGNLFTDGEQASWELLANGEREIKHLMERLSFERLPRVQSLLDGVLAPLAEARREHGCV